MSGPIELSWLDLAGAASLILLNGGLSLWLKLGLEKKLLVAALRTVVQLTLLGYLLVPVFSLEHPALVAAMGAVMIALAGRAAVKRSSRGYRGVFLTGLFSMVLGALPTTLLATVVLIGVEPFWAPRYAIPLLGMILGNALSGVSLGLDRALARFDEGRDEVELMLAWGATRWEAARPVAAEALRTGMIPILNSMTVVGLVTIPGMMTGQILGGTSPEQAARYQILILFLIAAATALGTTTAVLLTVSAVFDERHRLRVDRILKESS
jgi:putative ABC transport system permease protein